MKLQEAIEHVMIQGPQWNLAICHPEWTREFVIVHPEEVWRLLAINVEASCWTDVCTPTAVRDDAFFVSFATETDERGHLALDWFERLARLPLTHEAFSGVRNKGFCPVEPS